MLGWQDVLSKIGVNWPPLHWPPSETWATLSINPNHTVALRYFTYNTSLVVLALLLGLGVVGALLTVTRTCGLGSKKVLPSVLGLLAVSTGFAVMIAELFVLALFHLMTPEHVAQLYAVSVVLAVGTILLARRDYTDIVICPLISWNGCITLAVITLLLVCQMASIDSPAVGDSTSFHAPYAEVFLQHHGLAVDLNLIYPYHSLNLSIFYSLGLMLSHDLIYLQTMHALFATLSMFGIYIFCRATGQRAFIAVMLAFVFVELYTIRFARFQANVDLGSMFFVLCAVLGLYHWSLNRAATWLLACSAIAFGIAMGTKYIIVVIAIPIALSIALHTGRKVWRPLFTYMAWAACFGLWWYIRNWICTGNPVHPFANGIFGYYLWDATDMASQMNALGQSYVPRTLMGFLGMPYYAYADEVLWMQSCFAIITMLFITTACCRLVARPTNHLLIFCWIYLVSWMFGSQDPRHLMPIMPLVFIHFGAVMNAVWQKLAHLLGNAGTRQRWRSVLGALLIITLTWLALLYAAVNTREKFVHIYYEALEQNKENDLRFRENTTIDLFYAANEIFSENDTVYEFGMRDGHWFFHGHLVGTSYGPNGYYRVIDKVARPVVGGMSPELLERLLKQDYAAKGFMIPINFPVFSQSEFDAYFRLVYRNSLGSIYRFKDE